MKYFWLAIRHKWFVLLAGLKVGAPIWRLVIHDWTKFLPSEIRSYNRQFFGDAGDALGFITTWVHHQNAHQHHWEYWIPRTGHNRCDPPYPDNVPIPMPESAILEMVADWLGASRAYEGQWPKPGEWKWLNENFDQIRVHPVTRSRLRWLLIDYFDPDGAAR